MEILGDQYLTIYHPKKKYLKSINTIKIFLTKKNIQNRLSASHSYYQS